MYDVERVMALEPMWGKWASSRVDLGYTELFCIPEVTSVSSRLVTGFLGTLLSYFKQIEAPSMFDGNMELLCMQCRGIGPHLSARGKSHVFS